MAVMSWVEELKTRAGEKRDQAVKAAAEEYRREMMMIDELAKRLESKIHDHKTSNVDALQPATTSTEALREAFARLPESFTREDAFRYVREYYPSLVRDLSSAFNKLRNKRGEIVLVKPGNGKVLPTFRRARESDSRRKVDEKAPAGTGA